MRKLTKIGSARIYWLLLGLGVSLHAWTIRAEDAQSLFDSQSIIRVRSSLVAVPVSVTDADGQAVHDLGIDDFRIQEDGRIETIAKIADAGESPLQMALLFDLSGSLHSRFEFEQRAALRFLEKVWKQGDSVSIIAFNEQPYVRIKNCKFLPEAQKALGDLTPTESSTAFFDTVVLASRLLHQSAEPETRRSMIVLSDGEDNRSDRKADEALHQFRQSDAIFYSINPSGPSVRLNEISRKGQEDLASIAAETGGTAFVSDLGGDLDPVFARIANELRAQYLLSYYSSNPRSDNRFRRITVSLPNRPDLRVRARQGYIAVP